MCSGHLLLASPGYYLLKCTGDTNFGVHIGTNLGDQIWCPGDTIFYSVVTQQAKVITPQKHNEDVAIAT